MLKCEFNDLKHQVTLKDGSDKMTISFKDLVNVYKKYNRLVRKEEVGEELYYRTEAGDLPKEANTDDAYADAVTDAYINNLEDIFYSFAMYRDCLNATIESIDYAMFDKPQKSSVNTDTPVDTIPIIKKLTDSEFRYDGKGCWYFPMGHDLTAYFNIHTIRGYFIWKPTDKEMRVGKIYKDIDEFLTDTHSYSQSKPGLLIMQGLLKCGFTTNNRGIYSYDKGRTMALYDVPNGFGYVSDYGDTDIKDLALDKFIKKLIDTKLI